MEDHIATAEEFERKAEKRLRSWSGLTNKHEVAAERFQKAATAYKLGRSWNQAGSAYVKATTCYLKLDSKSEAAGAFVKAATCYKKTNSTEAVSCLERAVNLYLEMGRLPLAAKYYQAIAALYEAEQNFEQAIVYYESTAELFLTEEITTCAQRCKEKIAQFAAQLEPYPKAIEIYEEMARQSLNDDLLKYAVRGYLLNAGFFHFRNGNGDFVALNYALERYQELDLTFSRTHEYRFLVGLATAAAQDDVTKFTAAVKELDSITHLDAWAISLRSRVAEQELAEDDGSLWMGFWEMYMGL